MKRVLILIFLIASASVIRAQYYWVNYPNENDYASGIKTFFFENENNIWAGSVIKGIFHFINGQYVNYSEANSDISGNIVNKILLDENNSKWIATSKGLSVMIGDHIENYTTENSNILSNQVNDIAMAPGGRLWIASRDLCPSGIRPV